MYNKLNDIEYDEVKILIIEELIIHDEPLSQYFLDSCLIPLTFQH